MDGYKPAAPPPWQSSGGWRDEEPEELGVFTAERYFNGAEDDVLWCDRSSSAFSTVLRSTWQQDGGGSAPTPTAATSSSEASWNSRSALLPNGRPPVVAAAAAAVEEKQKPDSSSMTGSEQIGRKPPPSSSSHLWRWLLGMAGCGCACAGDGQESVSADDEEVEAGFVLGDTKGRRTEADATPNPVLLAESAHCPAAANSGELSSMPRMLNPAPPNASSYAERPRREFLESLHPAPAAAGQGSSRLASSANESSAFTIVAGKGSNTTRASACRSPPRGSGADEEDAAAPSELGCMYPPSEASVVWSVVTAEGPASAGNFSSAASGCYYYFNDDGGHGEAFRGIKTIKRRSRNNGSGGLLASCMSKRAVDTVGPPRAWAYRPEVVEPSPVPRVSGGPFPDVRSRR
ncbi:protein PHYTOCHROME KINASE SUBSTRATE 4 [Brachypodium distachyon]|uniref:Uncharacterized protein n=1 Tax=Brachypodium distachyon TaxID=15368 RepID=I1HKU5_BRADI|nr:protein PHYTOCHROME KINASE SUBSTRATE 4 [Brachypodium distachyon]KQK07002.1 hypothetical protein BRADI_2g31937v3 [Brachypodium distachyon]|eukprot:XP_014753833.1 protein PHYTOCHROME KINASE SUBSTRATE 4 [Brachypodium distachyon]